MLLLFSSLSTPLDNILNKWFFLYVALTHYRLHCILLISHLRLSLSLNQLCMYCIIALLCFISNSLNRHFLINLQVVIPFCSDINFAESRSSFFAIFVGYSSSSSLMSSNSFIHHLTFIWSFSFFTGVEVMHLGFAPVLLRLLHWTFPFRCLLCLIILCSSLFADCYFDRLAS